MFSKKFTDVKKVCHQQWRVFYRMNRGCEIYIFATLNQSQCSFGVVSMLCVCWVKVSETSGQVLFLSSLEKGLMMPTRINH